MDSTEPSEEIVYFFQKDSDLTQTSRDPHDEGVLTSSEVLAQLSSSHILSEPTLNDGLMLSMHEEMARSVYDSVTPMSSSIADASFEIVTHGKRGPRKAATKTTSVPKQRDLHEFMDDEMNANLNEKFTHPQHTDNQEPSALATYNNRQTSNNVRPYFSKQAQTIECADKQWVSKPEIPTAAEIMGEDVHDSSSQTESAFSNNIVLGGYDDTNEYLQAHHSFFRREATEPLRKAIEIFCSSPYMPEPDRSDCGLGIYDRVFITALTFSKRGIGVKVSFSLGRVGKNVKWDQSKRLLTGSMVVLSPKADMFADSSRIVVAVVAARPLDQLVKDNSREPPEIDLFFAKHEQLEVDTSVEWVMLEARNSFFEAQRHTMVALQKMTQESFPLSDFLIGKKVKVQPPRYVAQQPVRNLNATFPSENANQYDDVNILQNWPSNPPTTLDATQLEALHRILTKALALIQGPPGTGKTFVSFMALKTILAAISRDTRPIIVSAQTNHALDQLLRLVALFAPESFARLGGRSKDTTGIIQSRTLYNLKQKDASLGSSVRHASKQLRDLEKQMCGELEFLQADKGLTHEVLKTLGLLTEAQAKSIEKGDPEWEHSSDETPLQAWVGKQMDVRTGRQNPIEEFGQAYEEPELDIEALAEIEAENKPIDEDDDIERLKGRTITLLDKFVAKSRTALTDKEVCDQLRKHSDMWDIRRASRGAIFAWLLRQAKEKVRDGFRKKAAAYHALVKELQISRLEDDWRVLNKQRIIGMTTTGLSKYRAVVSSLQPQIILIEEAAETLEAPVIAACMESVEHLILVGDHQQLRPHCVLQEHEALNWNISMFERLVNNDLEYSMLQRQRRMIPEIRRVLAPIYGRRISDHPDMLDTSVRPPVPGMGGVNSYFFSHTWPEQRNEQMSSENAREAEMIIGFVEYLANNGTPLENITILTFYNGQRSLLLRKLRSDRDLHPYNPGNLKVVTVDSYQGEENDILILSTVRSNDSGSIGFLANDNRVCVALSRAKRGFYIFGNAEVLGGESETWADVIKIMAGKKKGKTAISERPAVMPRRVGFYFPVTCTRHGHVTFMQDPADWSSINGGCTAECSARLACGHQCPLKCHPFEEDRVNCDQPCNRPALPCGHYCIQPCSDPCECSICNEDKNLVRQADKNDRNDSAAQASKNMSWQNNVAAATQKLVPLAEATAPLNLQRPHTAPFASGTRKGNTVAPAVHQESLVADDFLGAPTSTGSAQWQQFRQNRVNLPKGIQAGPAIQLASRGGPAAVFPKTAVWPVAQDFPALPTSASRPPGTVGKSGGSQTPSPSLRIVNPGSNAKASTKAKKSTGVQTSVVPSPAGSVAVSSPPSSNLGSGNGSNNRRARRRAARAAVFGNQPLHATSPSEEFPAPFSEGGSDKTGKLVDL